MEGEFLDQVPSAVVVATVAGLGGLADGGIIHAI
jgi:hypothetical protein